MSDLYRLVYASKNLLAGAEADTAAAVAQILKASQCNNEKVDVTGALMFNAGAFAQVLEGPRRGVEETFERIQRDVRHGNVTVLQCGPAERRVFANWSMAFVGQSAAGRARWDSIAAESGFDLSRLDGDAVFAMLHGLVLEEEGIPAIEAGLLQVPQMEDRAVAALDIAQVRAEIEQLRPARTAVDVTSADAPSAKGAATTVPLQPGKSKKRQPTGELEAAVAVLKAALASERQRTTELRNEVDDLRVALATSSDQLEAVRQERDLWARRAHLLATALSQEAGEMIADPKQGEVRSTGGGAQGSAGLSARNAA